MNIQITTVAEYRAAQQLDPFHVEYPAHCTRCLETWSVYRVPDAALAAVLVAATAIHHELSPSCPASGIRLAAPIPFGPPGRSSSEEYADLQAH